MLNFKCEGPGPPEKPLIGENRKYPVTRGNRFIANKAFRVRVSSYPEATVTIGYYSELFDSRLMLSSTWYIMRGSKARIAVV